MISPHPTDTPPVRNVKHCPQCRATSYASAPECARCGHLFSSGLSPKTSVALHEQLAEAEINQTRMFTLPPFVAQPTPEGAPPPKVEELSERRAAMAARERAQRTAVFTAFGLAFLLIGGLWWWLLSQA